MSVVQTRQQHHRRQGEPHRRLDPSTGFTCVACAVVFADYALQREHYRSEWHRYNVKRQLAALPPITQALFAEKVEAFEVRNALYLAS